MAITAEWILNKNKKKIYAISHAKAVVRGNTTVEGSLSTIEENVSNLDKKIGQFDTNLGAAKTHPNALITSDEGVHGLRYKDNMLQYKDGDSWSNVETASKGLAPANMKYFEALPMGNSNDKLSVGLKGSDPDDFLDADGNVIYKWQGTKIVRKVGSYPKSVSDGVLIVDYQVRDQYKDAAFVDNSGLVSGTKYYYKWFPYSATGAVNIAENSNQMSCTPDATTLGVRINFETNSFSRLGAAVGKGFGSAFDQFKMYGQRRRCIVADDRTILAFYGAKEYTETGKTTVKITKNGKTYPVGTSAQVMVYQPKFYYKVVLKADTVSTQGSATGSAADEIEYYVSSIKLSGYMVHPDFLDADNNEVPYILKAAYEAGVQQADGEYPTAAVSDISTKSYKLSSVKGVIPQNNLLMNTAVSSALNRGTGWQIMDLLSLSSTQLLFVIEYAGMDSQKTIGTGVDSSPIAVTGRTSNLGNSSGAGYESSDTRESVSYRGEENLWGNTGALIGGLIFVNQKQAIPFYAKNHVNSKELLKSETETPSSWVSCGFNFCADYDYYEDYISRFGYSSNCDFVFIPALFGGTSSSPVGDSFVTVADASYNTTGIHGGDTAKSNGSGLYHIDTDFGINSTASGARLICIPSKDALEELDASVYD